MATGLLWGWEGSTGPVITLTRFGFSSASNRVQHVQEDHATFPEGCHPSARPLCKYDLGASRTSGSDLAGMGWRV